FSSKPYQGTASGVTVPAWGGPGDPTYHGAVITLYRPGGDAETVILALPSSNWERSGTAAKPGYRYQDSKLLLGPITSITLRDGKLTVKAKGAGTYQLDTAPQGSVAVRLRLGSEVELCAAAPAKAPASSNDTTAKFVASKNTPPPASCPAIPSAG